MIKIRPERDEDHDAIFKVLCAAFGRENEARLVDELRASDSFAMDLSLVALKDGVVAGHILFSPIKIEVKNGFLPALALAPLSVLPDLQNQGIGSELVKQGLARCRELGHKVVIVLGHPDYYTNLGFSSASANHIEAPFPIPDEAFMVLELVPGVLDGISGIVKYPAAFDNV